MKYFYLSFLIFVLFNQHLHCEKIVHTYLIEIDSALILSNFKNHNYYLDLDRIRTATKEELGDQFDKIKNFDSLIHSFNPIKVRKLLRNLPDTTKFLFSKKGGNLSKLSVEFPQRIYIVESYDSLNQSDFEMLRKNNKILINIEYSGSNEILQWPPNDPNLLMQDEYAVNPYNIDLPRAWRHSHGNSAIKVAILDHGVSYTHPDLGGGIGTGFRVRGGWDYKDNDANPLPVFETNKRERHGTPIAGIIGALNNNSTGVVGIAGGWETIESGVQLYSFRVSSDNVNSNGDRLIDRSLIPEAIIEIAADPSINDGFGYGCHVINCSFACSPQGVYFDNCNYWDWNTLTGRTTYWAYHTAFWLNATIVAGRGNEGNDEPVFPATYSNGGILMSISALDHNGDLFDNWWMSSFGDGVTLSAPGEIGSTTAVNENGNTYNFFSGTSNAAPFVSGTAALVLSRLHERNIYSFSEDIRNIIQIGANNAGLSGYDESLGWGRLDAGQSLHIVSPPFNLEHYTIPYEDLDIEEVTFPGSTLCLYIPFKCAFVKNVYRVRGTFNIPDKYQELDSVWVWANSFTTGLNWGNPSWGTPDATLISRVNRELIFETYIYKLLDIDGSQTYFWPPCDVPGFISLSLLGKDNSCIEDLYLTNIFIDKYDYYKAKNLISAENNVILSSNSDVSFKAGQEIILGPGFSVIEGGIFSAKIEDCYLDELELLKNSIHFNSDKVSDIKSNTLTIRPNPFDDVTRISVNLTEPSEIRLEVFDLLGNRVAIITSGEQFPIGSHDFTFSGHKHTSGVYYLKLTTNKEHISRQLLLIK